MQTEFDQHLNRTILVSIPALFGDGKCRTYTLRGASEQGLWLESDDLSKRLPLATDRQNYAPAGFGAFIPFHQIAGVYLPTETPSAQPSPGAGDKPPEGTATAKTQTSTKAARAR
jgi:hypothetical protein